MSLSAFRAELPEPKPREIREVIVGDHTMRFRVPEAPDFYQREERTDALSRDFPRLTPKIRFFVILMASGYQIEDEDRESGLSIDHIIADLANRDAAAFGKLVTAYSATFPEIAGKTEEMDTSDPLPSGGGE